MHLPAGFLLRELACYVRSVTVRALSPGLYSEELCDVCISTGVVRVVKCWRLGWAGYIARMDVT